MIFTKVAVLDFSLNYICVNKAWLRDDFFSSEKTSCIGKNIFEIGPFYTEDKKQILNQSFSRHSFFMKKEDVWNNSKTFRCFSWEIQPWFQETQKFGGLILFFEDVLSPNTFS